MLKCSTTFSFPSNQFSILLCRYRCVARNQAEDSAEGQLIVKSVATIVRGPSDRTETIGSEVSHYCHHHCHHDVTR